MVLIVNLTWKLVLNEERIHLGWILQ